MINDRRKVPRIICNLPSSFRDSDSTKSWSSHFVCVKDISRGGMRIRTHKAIPLTETLTIAFVVPGNKKPVEATITPTWSCEVSSADSFDTGVRFVEMSQEAEDVIRQYC